MGPAPDEVNEANRCGIAWRLGAVVACPDGGCPLLRALGYSSPTPMNDEPCATHRLARHVGVDGDVLAALVEELGYVADPASRMCPVEALAERSGSNPVVVRTLDEVRRDLDRGGAALSAVRLIRTRERRHEEALHRWPVRP